MGVPLSEVLGISLELDLWFRKTFRNHIMKAALLDGGAQNCWKMN